MNIEEIYNKSEEEYNENYSNGEYCHEQSFKWGFQEGVFSEQIYLINKACKIYGELLDDFFPDLFYNNAIKEQFINNFKKRLEE